MTDSEVMHAEFTSLCNSNPLPVVNAASPDIPKFQHVDSFCDKHIDQSSFLRHVRLAPTLLSDISKSVDVVVDALKEKGQRLPSIDKSEVFPTKEYRAQEEEDAQHNPLSDAAGIAERYSDTIGTYCTLVASTLVLHPYAPEWHTTLYFSPVSTRYRNFSIRDEEYPFLRDDSKTDSEAFSEFWNSFDDATLDLIRRIIQRYPELAVWQMLTPDAEEILREMDKWSSPAMQEFNHEQCGTRGLSISENVLPRPADAALTGWDIPTAAFVESLTPKLPKRARLTASSSAPVRRSERLSALNEAKSQKLGPIPGRSERKPSNAKAPQWRTVRITPNALQNSKTLEDLSSSLIQHAWSLAVRRDSTFIVFNCGNYERIGFRHRKSQTLFLSKLVDIPNCKDPAYGKLHIGLYVCILKDVIDRISQHQNPGKSSDGPKNRKRKRETFVSVPVNRPRTRAYEAQQEKRAELERKQKDLSHILGSELASRDLGLLVMRYGCYNSIAPAAMVPIGQSLRDGLHTEWKAPSTSEQYQPHQYFILTIASEIAKGAVGFAYRGTVKILTNEGNTMTHDIVVKLAFRPDQQERMRNEYRIYEHLASAEVKGIPVVHGLFKDVESDVVALIMDDAGETILKRWDIKERNVYRITESERAGFERILKDIHNAGVRHRDIRAENMTIDKDGNPYIIDFDRARINRQKNATQREWHLLRGIFKGLHPEYVQTTEEMTMSGDSDDSFETQNPFFAQFFREGTAVDSFSDDDDSDDSE